jgi:hypothetical protein
MTTPFLSCTPWYRCLVSKLITGLAVVVLLLPAAVLIGCLWLALRNVDDGDPENRHMY